jgi:hypothetical protein
MKTRFRLIVLLVMAVILAAALVMPAAATSKDAGNILLRGTIVTPDGVLKHGYILIEDGRIVEVTEQMPDPNASVMVNTESIIFPGLIDLHNHVSWNVLPRWHPAHLYSNRYQWRSSAEYLQLVGTPYNNLVSQHFCDMNLYGEIRALVGGTTSMLATNNHPCIQGLVRNLDFGSGFYGSGDNLEHILNVLDVPPPTPPIYRQIFVQQALALFGDPRWESFFIHLAEGVDAASLEEFYFLYNNGLLTHKGGLIHAIPLGPAEYQIMRNAGVGLVWSPHSNVELYGTTANLNAALDAGVQIALAPDWAITGSSNMLDELHYASMWNDQHLAGRLTAQQLVEMVTINAAQIAGIEDEVGSIRPGLRADLLVIEGDHNNSYHALVGATAADVQLVLIDGVAVFGAPHYMLQFWSAEELETLEIDDTIKMIHMSADGKTFASVMARLQTALASQGVSLAPITER